MSEFSMSMFATISCTMILTLALVFVIGVISEDPDIEGGILKGYTITIVFSLLFGLATLFYYIGWR